MLREVKLENWFAATEAPDDPLPADPLSDLNTRENALSVWQVPDDRSNLEDIVTAIAARKYIREMDVALIEESLISDLGIEILQSEGKTPLTEVRPSHRNLAELEAQDLVRIADVMRKALVIEQFSVDQVENLIAGTIQSGRLRPSDLQRGAREHLERKGLIPPQPS